MLVKCKLMLPDYLKSWNPGDLFHISMACVFCDNIHQLFKLVSAYPNYSYPYSTASLEFRCQVCSKVSVYQRPIDSLHKYFIKISAEPIKIVI
jgi:hypothetical protein